MFDWLDIRGLATAATGLVFGGMFVFSFVVAPATFEKLGKQAAGDLMGALFPAYYLAMTAAAVVGVGLLAIIGNQPVEVAVLAAVAFGFIGARRGLLPRAQAARAAMQAGDDAASARFRRLHGTSMVLNLIQLLAALFVLLRLA